MGMSIFGDLDVDDEGSKQCRFEPVRTRIGLAKKAMSLQVNQEHEQE
jgi:hypothetical protein